MTRWRLMILPLVALFALPYAAPAVASDDDDAADDDDDDGDDDDDDDGDDAGQGGFTDVTDEVGIAFERERSASFAILQQIREGSLIEPYPIAQVPLMPGATRGLPGVAIIDFDNDGDLDIFGTNGPGGSNALYENQLEQTGELYFNDVAAAKGVDAVDMDANGTCHGDLDNDGDADLLVLGRAQPNRLFENLGGTFELVQQSGVDQDASIHLSCSMGDVDGDGYLDIVVSNTFDFSTLLALFAIPFDFNQHNQLYINDGNLSFSDESNARGIESLGAVPPGAATITWATSMADVDLDGDQDIIFTDDNGAMVTTKYDPVNGVNRGFMQVMKNDGTGYFTAEAQTQGPESPGAWMAVGFGDLDHDGSMDMFGSNFGDYAVPSIDPTLPYQLGDQSTRFYLGDGAGGFTDPLGGTGPATSFGWGNAVFDADNDGDSDLAYFGGMDLNPLAITDNPGVFMRNTGSGANFEMDLSAFNMRHLSRGVHGAGIGDLDRDGFVDIVTIANWLVPEGTPTIPSPAAYGSPLDGVAGFVPLFAPDGLGGLIWTGLDLAKGDLRVDLNDADSGHAGVTVTALGTVGLTDAGQTNRGGVGAVVTFKPKWEDESAMMPITAGASHTSSHASEAYFGLGDRPKGRVDVLWPGGARTRLYGVQGGEHVVMPETGCGYNQDWANAWHYKSCVLGSLFDLLDEGHIQPGELIRHYISALVAYYHP